MAKQTFTTGQVLTAAQVNALQTNDFNQTVSAKTASYVLVAADKGTRIEFSTSGSVTCTVNTGLFDAGDTVYIQNTGAGVVTITAGTATVNTSASLAVNQYEGGVLYFVSASSAIWFEFASTATGDITGITTGANSGLTGGVTSGTADLKLNVTAKGDLLPGTGSGAVSTLTVGANGETLVADSSATTGLRWQGNFAAGKNAAINGDFRIAQRGTSISIPTGAWTYHLDRWQSYLTFSAGTFTASQQTFTPGTAPVAGYEGANFLRLTAPTTGTSTVNLRQLIEDVRTFAGQTVTFSFWAKASANTSMAGTLRQNFGSGGSASVDHNWSTFTVTTSWQRFSQTITLGSLSGKTIGTGSALEFYPYSNNNFTGGATLDFWGMQIEIGNTATAFQTATGTLAGELAACQRYYYVAASGSSGSISNGFLYAASYIMSVVQLPVTMRIGPSLVFTSGTNYYVGYINGTLVNFTGAGWNINRTSTTAVWLFEPATGFGGTAGQGIVIGTSNASTSLAFSAEL